MSDTMLTFLVGTGDYPLVSRRQVAIHLVACVKEASDMNCGLICLREKLRYELWIDLFERETQI